MDFSKGDCLKISKTYSIDCAHILSLDYPSKCTRLHGHTYTVTIELEGRVKKNGMVHDYSDFPKDCVMLLDHKLLMCDKYVFPGEGRSHIEIGDYRMSVPNDDLYIIPKHHNTTAECIALHLLEKIQTQLPTLVAHVSVQETGSSAAWV